EMSILLFDPACPSGLLNLLDNLKRTASLVRERLSVDAWRILNTLYDLTRRHAVDEQLDVSGALALLNEMAQECSGFSGMQQENMTRSIGWRLLDFGRRAERGGHMARLMRELTIEGDPEAEGSLDLLLELGDSSMTYRTRYLSTVQLPAVLDLLLVDETNPRSVAYQVAAIEEHMSALPRADNHGTLSAEQRLVIAAASELKLCNINELCRQHNARGRRVALEKFLRTQEQRILDISDNVARIYFTHDIPTRSGSVG
ncbi:MAG: alpha-E domain-containing protein, partial [Rickettsiales bacterium]